MGCSPSSSRSVAAADLPTPPAKSFSAAKYSQKQASKKDATTTKDDDGIMAMPTTPMSAPATPFAPKEEAPAAPAPAPAQDPDLPDPTEPRMKLRTLSHKSVNGEEKMLRQHLAIIEAKEGPEKDEDGFRLDSKPIMESLAKLGWTAEIVFYDPKKRDSIIKHITEGADAVINRVMLSAIDDVDDYLSLLSELGKHITLLTHPDTVLAYADKSSFSKLVGASKLVEDTFRAYVNWENFADEFPKSLATHSTRIIKRAISSKGVGTFKVSLVEPAEEGTESVPTEAAVRVLSAETLEMKECTLGEFIESQKETSSTPRYNTSSGGVIVDQPFHDRIAEGEFRLIMSHRKCVAISVKVPSESSELCSEADAGAKVTLHEPSEFPDLVDAVQSELSLLQATLHPLESMPLLWSIDILKGAADADGKDSYEIIQTSCGCVSIVGMPNVTEVVAHEVISMVMEKTTLKKKVAIIEIPGGPSKGDDGYLPNTLAAVERIRNDLGWVCEVVFYRARNHDKIIKYLEDTADALVTFVSAEELSGGNIEPEVKDGLEKLLEHMVNSPSCVVFPYPSLGRDGTFTTLEEVPPSTEIRDVVVGCLSGVLSEVEIHGLAK